MVYDVIIIGSGPSGLTAGIYTSRAKLSTLILGGTKPGGQLMLTSEVENFPGFPEGIMGPELMDRMRKQAERFGTEIIDKDVTKVDFSGKIKKVWVAETEYQARVVIIATGANSIWLGLPSEQKLIGRGVSSCAPCDAFFFRDKKVAVIGGGDSAMEEALVLTKFASEVSIIHRREAFRASKIMQDRVLSHPKIKAIFNQEVLEILGDAKVTGIVLKDTTNNKQSTINVDGVFVAIGHKPNSNIFAGQVTLDPKGYVLRQPNEMYKSISSIDGVFVAGDIHDHHYRQAVTAAAYGCESALEAEKYLEDMPHGN